jgi:SAM-dependent methyltransferase
MTGVPPTSPWPPLAKRAAAAERIYEGNPERFRGPPSRFFGWAFAQLRPCFPRGQVLELGCGTGRDARAFFRAGYSVLGVDYSATAIERARAEVDPPGGLRFRRTDALTALRDTLSDSLSAVYAHAVYMMLPEDELEGVFDEVRRTLHPGGLHLFAVRSTTDPVAGQGVEVAPDVWQRTAGGPPHRYFRPATVDRLTARGFERVALEFPEGLHFGFVADRRP